MTTARLDPDGPLLVVEGTGPRPDSAVLDGSRARVAARLTGRGRTWRARFPLAVSRWGGPVLPLPAGSYRVRIPGVVLDAAVDEVLLPGLRARLDGDALVVGPPIPDDAVGAAAQAALARRHREEPLENAVFLESFYGRTAGCNPLAIDAELSRRAPAVTRYWSVADLSVPVPDGAVAVVEGTPEWWRARSTARLLVVNDWLRHGFRRRRGQRVVQTWHGTPLKRLALHRPGFAPRRWGAVVKESLRWDVLLAQNPYAARALSRAYAFRRPVWVEGYPRNDALVTGDAAAARARLGLAPGERAILYAPTWRDDRERIVDFLDPAALARAAGAVVLVRGHSRTLGAGADLAGPRVVDVTSFPDTAQLLLAADVLVTDYSSVMFDFSVTGKPMLFLVPDLERYRGELRGFFFDLARHAPGPLVRTADELVLALEADQAEHAERYAAWQARFNARDDGRAAERVVARILDRGFVSR